MQYQTRFAIWLTIMIAAFYGSATAQSIQPTPSPAPLTDEQILDAVEAQTTTYVETFKNLLADETKTFELFGKNNEVKKQRVVRSTFIVFPLMKAEGQVVEFRNVSSVDNKKINDSDKRAGELITKLASVETSEKEINKLRDESSRHDLDIAISGMTLYQVLAVDKELRKFFKFTISRPGPSGGNTFSIDYRQTLESPDITVNSADSRPVGRAGLNFDVDLGKDVPANARLSGTIIVDAVTSKVVGETRNVTIQAAGYTQPITVVEDRFTYQESVFGIFTPKVITHTQYRVTSEMRAEKQLKVTFEYGNFTRPDVSVKADEVKSKQDQ